MIRDIKRYFFIGTGLLFVCLGLIGVVLPIVPTTPFLLVAAALFFRSSQRLHHWLINNSIFGEQLHRYITYHAISMRAKISALSLLWISIGYTVIFVTDLLWLRLLLFLIAAAVSVHVLLLKTWSEEDSKQYGLKGHKIEQDCR